jgi:hypothetical protein
VYFSLENKNNKIYVETLMVNACIKFEISTNVKESLQEKGKEVAGGKQLQSYVIPEL